VSALAGSTGLPSDIGTVCHVQTMSVDSNLVLSKELSQKLIIQARGATPSTRCRPISFRPPAGRVLESDCGRTIITVASRAIA
jgi:hypothetical protein